MPFKTIPISPPDYVKELLPRILDCNGFVAGGAVRAIYNKEPIRDLDIFVQTYPAFSAVKAGMVDLGLNLEFENPMLARFSKQNSEGKFEYSIDVVTPRQAEYLRTVGTPEQVISHFDFTVARAAIISKTHALVDEVFEDDCKNKRLKIRHIVCPLSTVQRIGKYVAKGYTICTKEVVKLFIEYGKRNTSELEELLGKDNLEGEELARLLQYVYVD